MITNPFTTATERFDDEHTPRQPIKNAIYVHNLAASSYILGGPQSASKTVQCHMSLCINIYRGTSAGMITLYDVN